MSHGSEPSPHAPTATQPMQHGHRPASSAQVEATLVPETGWHFLHLFYRVDRAALSALDPEARRRGRGEVIEALGRPSDGSIEQLQSFAVPGHKADFGVVLAGPRAPPQVLVEDLAELLEARERHQLPRVLEADLQDHLAQDRRGQRPQLRRELRVVEHLLEQGAVQGAT